MMIPNEKLIEKRGFQKVYQGGHPERSRRVNRTHNHHISTTLNVTQSCATTFWKPLLQNGHIYEHQIL